MAESLDELLSVERWRRRAVAEPRRRLIGRYCCPQAAALRRTNCGRHGDEGLTRILAAHGLCEHDLGTATVTRLTIAVAGEKLR